MRSDDKRILPQPDETVSSWLGRTLGRRQLKYGDFMAAADRLQPGIAEEFARDPDYVAAARWRETIGLLTHVGPDALNLVGHPPSPWVLKAGSRESVCVACLDEDGTTGAQYMRQAWTDSWRTVCHHHGMPLVRVPAVGWGWVTKGRAMRKRFRALVRRPGDLVPEYRKYWRVLPRPLVRCVGDTEVALLGAWSEYYRSNPAGEDHASGTQVRVWEDLLTLVSLCWTPMAQPSLAAAALPAKWVTSTQFLRTPTVAPAEVIDLSHFRSMPDPAARRVVVVIAGDAMLGFSHQPRADPHWKRYQWGWHHVLMTLPSPARVWLTERSRQWPAAYRQRADEWVEMALVGSSGSSRR